MQFENFKRIVTTFADEDGELLFEGGKLLMSIRGQDLEAQIQEAPNGVLVIHDDGSEWRAEKWIRSVLARLDMLADRIIKYVSPPEHFVSPSGKLSDNFDHSAGDLNFNDSTSELRQRLGQQPAGMTSIYFLTSDAGEGKTSLIEKISVDQALAFKEKQASTLILPVPLGGRSFQQFDDAVIALLSNKLRFQFLYYDSFLELVKMGAIIPAFDGYEEMLVDSETGEAILAISNLVEQLSSSGTLLVTAHRGYFNSSLRAQSRVVDSVRIQEDIEIHHYALDRWNREVFLEYARKREIPCPDELYENVKQRLGREDHPVLTRAVLVRRLMDVAKEDRQIDIFLDRLGQSQTDYFFDFVDGIIHRESEHKWIDRSGTDQSRLLTLDEHHELLAEIASEMWICSVDALNLDVVQVIIEIFVEANNMRPDIFRQIDKRITDHALLRHDVSPGRQRDGRVRFDHEDFQAFYLGQALGRALCEKDKFDASMILGAGSVTSIVIKEATRYLMSQSKMSVSFDTILRHLKELLSGKWHISYSHENSAALMLELLESSQDIQLPLTDTNFPVNMLSDRKLRNLDISNSFFNVTSISNSELIDCKFTECHFAELAIDHFDSLQGTIFRKCTFDSIVVGSNSEEGTRSFFDPQMINSILRTNGFQLQLDSEQEQVGEMPIPAEMDKDMKIAMRFMRMFSRATAIPENVIGQRIGRESGKFFNSILPQLETAQLVKNTGTSISKWRLMIPLSEIDKLIGNSGSSFHQFIEDASRSVQHR